MTTIHVHLTDELKSKAEHRAAQAGATLEQYVQALIQADVDPPGHLTFKDEAHLQKLLQEGIDSGPAREISDAEWEQKRDRLIARHSNHHGARDIDRAIAER